MVSKESPSGKSENFKTISNSNEKTQALTCLQNRLLPPLPLSLRLQFF